MATYRSLLLGCGPRAHEHADVYREIPNMQMVACCDLMQERRDQFRAKYDIPEAYDDYETALAQVQPDIVHVVTQPARRIWEVECAAQAGVKAVIVEKPMAVVPSEIIALDEIHRRSGMQIIVNCQRRYFPQFRDGVIRDIVHEDLGELYFVRASTKGNSMSMGPHMMDLLMLFLDEAQPEMVWAMGHDIVDTGYQAYHRSPERLLAEYWFPGDLRVIFDCDADALGSPGETSFWMHLHFDFLGSRGRLYLTQNQGYWYQTEGMAEPVHGESSWDKQGWAGQRDFTAAVAEALDGGKRHLNRFEVGKAVFDALIGAQQSIYEGRRVSLPHSFTDQQWTELREMLKAAQEQ